MVALAGWTWPGELNRLCAAATEAYRQGRFDDAAGQYGKALALGADSPELAYNLGTSLLQQHDYAHAWQALGHAVEHSQNPLLLDQAHYNRGNALFRLDQFAEAAKEYEAALKADPRDEDAAYNLAVCRRRLQQQQDTGGGGQNGGQGGPTMGAPVPSASDRDPQRRDRPTPMTEAEVDRVLAGLEQGERDRRDRFDAHASSRRGRPTDFDEALRNLREDGNERDW